MARKEAAQCGLCQEFTRLDELSAQQTEVRYRSEVSVNGRLGKFGFGLMRKKADELGKQFGERFRARVMKTDQMENM